MLKASSILLITLIVRVFGIENPFLLNFQDLLDTSNLIKSIADENLPVENLLSNNSQLNDAFNLIMNLEDKFVGFEYRFSYQLELLLEKFKFNSNIVPKIHKITLPMLRTDFIYEMFLEEIKRITNFDKETLEKLVNNLFVGKTSVQKFLSQLYERVIPLQGPNLWEIIQTNLENLNTSEICDMDESYQYLTYKFYAIVILTELKGLTINMYLFKTYISLMNVPIADLVERAQGEFVRRTNHYLQSFQKVISNINREIYSCDSKLCNPGKDYLELEGLFTAYVINENESGTFEDTCVGDCEELQSLLHRRCYENNGQEFCTSHKCRGLIYKCQKIGGKVDFCEENPSSLKRYRYIKSRDKNKLYGKESDCKNGKYATLDTFWFKDNACDVCLCECSEDSDSSRAIRAFSLRPQISNIDKNKVVSNFRFVLKDNLMHVQIEESRLQKYGHVDKYSLSWVPLENFTDGSIPRREDEDFGTISRHTPFMNLDQISAGFNYVLTGVRLNRGSEPSIINHSNENPIQLQIHVTPFDFISGQLNPTKDNPSIWLSSTTQPNPPPEYLQARQENILGGYVYKYEQESNIPDVKPNRFVKFQQSSVESDAGQSTIPFLDARPASSRNSRTNPMAFSGAGIIHRRNNKFAGLLALNELTIDLSNYINTNIEEDQINYYEQLPPLPLTYNEMIQ